MNVSEFAVELKKRLADQGVDVSVKRPLTRKEKMIMKKIVNAMLVQEALQ